MNVYVRGSDRMSLWDQKQNEAREKRAKLKKWNFIFLIISFLFLSIF